MSGFTPGPWFVFDQRESYMRSIGWPGPFNDAILISSLSPKDAVEAQGDNCIVARISFNNRAEKLGENNLADAHLIAAAPDLLEALQEAEKWFGPFSEITINGEHDREDVRVVALMRAAIAKALGEQA